MILILICSFTCKQQGNEWKGSIEEENGVMVVKNPKEPLYSEAVFSLEEELSIGEAEGREEYMFSQVRSIAIDDRDRIYVLDYKEAHIKVFDNNGEYIKTIGKKGQGPGELEMPVGMFISNKDELIIEDAGSQRITFYSLEGKFIKNLSTAKLMVGRTHIDSRGNFIGLTIEREEENPRYELKKYGSNLKYLCSLGSSPLPSRQVYEIFLSLITYDVTLDDNIIVGYPEEYNLKIFNPEGKLIKRIEKEYSPVEISKEEIEERKKTYPKVNRKLVIPKYHAAYRSFAVDEENRIYVGTWERTEDSKGYYYDVFDSEGKYLANMPLNVRPWIWKKKKLYTLEEDEGGYQIIKRYKVKWEI